MFRITEMQEADIPEASALLLRLFQQTIAEHFPTRSRTGIRQYISEAALYARHNFHHFGLVCRRTTSGEVLSGDSSAGDSSAEVVYDTVQDFAPRAVSPPWQAREHAASATTAAGPITGEIVGVIEVREHRHISLLFVDDNHQRRGIGRALLDRAIVRCRDRRPELHEITVRAAPQAVQAYRRLGFLPDPARDEEGSPALAMCLRLDSASSVPLRAD